jgi:hypothetical protein
MHGSRDSVVGMATSYVLDDRGVGVRIPVGPEVYPTFYLMDTGGSFPGVKRPWPEFDYSPPISVEVRKYGSIHSFPIRLHGEMLNYLSTGTTLLYFMYV